MKTTKFEPKEKLDVFVLELREQILKAKMTADVDITSTRNINISKVKLNEAVYHTAPYDQRYGNSNWYIDEEEVPGKKKGTTQIVPVARNVFDGNMRIPIKKSKRPNYDDWCILNQIINEIADEYGVTFNLKSTTHTIRQGADWGFW